MNVRRHMTVCHLGPHLSVALPVQLAVMVTSDFEWDFSWAVIKDCSQIKFSKRPTGCLSIVHSTEGCYSGGRSGSWDACYSVVIVR